jgi:hypothetical protein
MQTQHATWRVACLIIAIVLFGLSAWSASWVAPQNYWNGRFVAAGLFFWALSTIEIS